MSPDLDELYRFATQVARNHGQYCHSNAHDGPMEETDLDAVYEHHREVDGIWRVLRRLRKIPGAMVNANALVGMHDMLEQTRERLERNWSYHPAMAFWDYPEETSQPLTEADLPY